MKVVILAGGMGTRISEESYLKPKPMIEIGGMPILWHIMKDYSLFGFNEFILCLGYKGYMIKEYFANYFLHQSDVTIDVKMNKIKVHKSTSEPWQVTLVDTGLTTMTGGRLQKIRHYIGNETFMLTYGDGVSDIDIKELVKFHKSNKRYATLTAVQPVGKFGAIEINTKNKVISFREKPRGDGSWINGGFFVLEPDVFDYIKKGDDTIWEKEPLEDLAKDNQLTAYKHNGFWQCMDTLRDRTQLEELWAQGKAPWKLWKR